MLNDSINKILEVLFKTEKRQTPSEWAEENRYMTSSVSAFTGKFSFKNTPYSREIANFFDPLNPYREMAIMKSAQAGVSTAIECAIGYKIKNDPCNILFMMADMDLGERAFNQKIDQMIDSSGLRDLIRTNSATSKRTGNTSHSKEFRGGKLQLGSMKNAGKLRQESYAMIIADDTDAAERDDKKEGNIRSLLRQRANSFAETMKLAYISSPTIKQTSFIEPAFEMGDQRRYFMPCPLCGEMIVFEWFKKTDDGYCGVIYDTNEEGYLIEGTVRYRCQECGGEFKENKKQKMMSLGKWIPTSEPKVPLFVSYHISAMYSPIGFFSWTDYARQWAEIQRTGDQGKLKSFLNVVLGQTYEERGKSTSSNRISQNTRPYKINEIPLALSKQDGNGAIVSLLLACDLNGMEDDARLDYEIVAVSENESTYSVSHGSIGTFQKARDKRREDEGREKWTYRHGVDNSVWGELLKIINADYYVNEGGIMKIHLAGIDTGYFTNLAYTFIESCNNAVGLMGDTITSNKLYSNKKRYQFMSDRNDTYILNVNRYKDDLADFIDLTWDNSQSQQPRFMNFPTPSDGKYTQTSFFIEFEGEHKIMELNKNGDAMASRWKKKKDASRNHFWDVRVYILALKDIYSDIICRELGHEIGDKQIAKYPSWEGFCKIMKYNLYGEEN